MMKPVRPSPAAYQPISGRRLLGSWILIAIGILLYEWLGEVGLVLALLPLGIAQTMRRDHDRALVRRLRGSGRWKVLAAGCYVVLLVVVLVAAERNVRLFHLPTVTFAFMILFPFVVPMIVNDAGSWLGRYRKSQNNGGLD